MISYDPDQIQALYVTPHRWTGFFRQARSRRVIEGDRRRWDYKHQVLESQRMKPWQAFALVKTVELAAQLRPRALGRLLYRPDARLRHATRWYYEMGRRVWFREVWEFLRAQHAAGGPTLAEFWGAPQDEEEFPLVNLRRRRVAAAKRSA